MKKQKNSLNQFKNELKALYRNSMPRTANFGGDNVGYVGSGSFSYDNKVIGRQIKTGSLDEAQSIEDMLPQVNSADATLTVTVANTLLTNETVVLFGAFDNAASGVVNFGNPVGVNITVAETSYARLMEESKSAPKYIRSFRMSCSNSAQFNNKLSIVQRSSQGAVSTLPVQPSRYTNPKYFNAGIVDFTDVQFSLAGDTEIEVLALANTSFTLTLNVKTQVDMSNTLKAIPVLKTAENMGFAHM